MNRAAVIWRGQVPGDGTGHQASYYVRLFADGTATCECKDYVLRGLEREGLCYRCKHIRRALADQIEEPALPTPTPPVRDHPPVPADVLRMGAGELARRGRHSG